MLSWIKRYRKLIFIMLLIISIIIPIGFLIEKENKLMFKRRIEQTWCIEKCSYYNHSINMFVGQTIAFTIFSKNDVDLPTVFDKDNKTNNNIEDMFTSRQGTWEIISYNPDSIIINAANNPLAGRYAVRFYDYLAGNKSKYPKMELSNANVHIVCFREVLPLDTRPWR